MELGLSVRIAWKESRKPEHSGCIDVQLVISGVEEKGRLSDLLGLFAMGA